MPYSIARIVLFALGCLALRGEPLQEPARDAYGDPLPAGAVGRIGSSRLKHRDRITFVGHVPGAPLLATASIDGSVRLWNEVDGRAVTAFEGDGAVVSACILPREGREPLVALADPSGRVEIRELRTGELSSVVEECGRLVRSSGGSRLVASGLDESLRLVVDVERGEMVTLECGYQTGAVAERFPSGEVAVVAVNRMKLLRRAGTAEQPSSVLLVFSEESGAKLLELPLPSAVLTDVAFGPGATLIAGDDGGRLYVWDLASGGEIASLAGGGSAVTRLAVSGRVAVGHEDGTIRFFDPDGWEEVERLDAGGAVAQLAYRGDRLAAAVGSSVRTWRLPSGDERDAVEEPRFPRHGSPVSRLRFAAGGLVSSGYDRSVRVWDVEGGGELVRFDGNEGFVFGLDVASDGSTIVTGGQDGIVRVRDVERDERKTLTGHGKAVTDVALSPDGKNVASVSADRTAVVWSIATCEVLRRVEGLKGVTFSLLYTPDGERLVVGGSDLRVLDAVTGDTIYRMEGFGAPITALAIAPDGATLAVGLADRSIRMIDVVEGVETRALHGHMGRITALACSPDGALLGSSSNNEAGPRLWTVATGAPLRSFAGHERDVTSLCFSPDGKVLAAGSMDGAILLWGVAHSR